MTPRHIIERLCPQCRSRQTTTSICADCASRTYASGLSCPDPDLVLPDDHPPECACLGWGWVGGDSESAVPCLVGAVVVDPDGVLSDWVRAQQGEPGEEFEEWVSRKGESGEDL